MKGILQLLRWLSQLRRSATWMPRGNGMFVSRVRKLSHIVDRVERGNLKWVAVLRDFHGADKRRPNERIRFNRTKADLATINELRDAGLDIVAWSYPHPGFEREYVDSLEAAIDAWGAVSLMIDPEHPYIGRHEGHPHALTLNDMMREMCNRRGVSYGMSTYAGVWNFDDPIGVFPFEAFLDADYVIPQTYTWKPGYVERAHAAYLAMGYKEYQLQGAAGSYRNSLDGLDLLAQDVYLNARSMATWKWETTSRAEFDVIGRHG